MNGGWEREVERTLALARAVLQPAPALAWMPAAQSAATDPGTRFDALLASLLGPAADAPAARAEEPVGAPVSAAFAAAGGRREDGWMSPFSAASPASQPNATPFPGAFPIVRPAASRPFADPDPSSPARPSHEIASPSAAHPASADFHPPSTFDAFPAPLPDGRGAAGGADGWTPAPPPSAARPGGWNPRPMEDATVFGSEWRWDADLPDRAPAARDGGASADAHPPVAPLFSGVRLASSAADLQALLQAHVDPPASAAPLPFPAADSAPADAHRFAEDRGGFEAAPGRTDDAAPAVPAAPQAFGGVDAAVTANAGGGALFAAFPGTEPRVDALAEEMLLDRLLERMEDRVREESIRRFGLTGGAL